MCIIVKDYSERLKLIVYEDVIFNVYFYLRLVIFVFYEYWIVIFISCLLFLNIFVFKFILIEV